MSIVYLNGEYIPESEARISVFDRGFMFGDGIYEVIPVYAGKPFRLHQHIERLNRSLKAIRLELDWDETRWHNTIETLINKNPGENFNLYIQITRGSAGKREHAFPAGMQPTILLLVSAVAKPGLESLHKVTGEHAIVIDDIRWARCDIKSVNLLPNILFKQEASDAGCSEAILIRDGHVTEAAAANVFVVKNGRISTPPISQYLLGGITRDLLIELSRHDGLNIEEAPISKIELFDADEVWISSSTREIVPIITLNGAAVGNGEVGPVWKQATSLYLNYKRSLF